MPPTKDPVAWFKKEMMRLSAQAYDSGFIAALDALVFTLESGIVKAIDAGVVAEFRRAYYEHFEEKNKQQETADVRDTPPH